MADQAGHDRGAQKTPESEQPLDQFLKFGGCLLAFIGLVNELDSGGRNGGVLVAGILLVIASYLRRIIRLLEARAN